MIFYTNTNSEAQIFNFITQYRRPSGCGALEGLYRGKIRDRHVLMKMLLSLDPSLGGGVPILGLNNKAAVDSVEVHDIGLQDSF